MHPPVLARAAAHFSQIRSLRHVWMFLRAHLFTRENAWAILVSMMLLLVLLLGAMNSQPRFVYSGF